MKKLEIKIDEYKNEFQKELDRMHKNLEYLKLEIENMGYEAKNYDNRLIEILDASVIGGLINCLSNKGLEIIDDLSSNKKAMLNYYFKMITSHIRFFEDFEFYNMALITRYLLESTAGIMINAKNLEFHFNEFNEKAFNESFKQYNNGIRKAISENMGKDYGLIYKKLSRFIHPMNGPLFGVEPKVVSIRNHYIVKSAIKIYIKSAGEIFKICGYELESNIEKFILRGLDLAFKDSDV